MEKKLVLYVLVFILAILGVWGGVRAEGECGSDLDCLSRQIQELTKSLEMSRAATKPLESQVAQFDSKIKSLQKQITEAVVRQKAMQGAIVARERIMAEQYKVLSQKTREFYKRMRSQTTLVRIVMAMGDGNLNRELTYRSEFKDKDRQVIVELSKEIIRIEKDKEALVRENERLAGLQASLDAQSSKLKVIIKEAKAYQSSLTNQIASLSAKQQQLIAEKLGSLNLPTSLGGGTLNCTDDRKIDPGFGNAFAFFTYGIPHRVGMSQYGAKARAIAGQSAEDILRAYFDNFDFSSGKENESVKVNGKNEFGQVFSNESMNIEEYLKHLYEMPPSWDGKALQAQAIAARSYALYEQKAKGFVYPSQKDQVVKRELNVQSWIDAVVATRGKVMTQGGEVVKVWYASTAGGYTFNSGDIWSRNTSHTKRLRDTSGNVSSFGDLQSLAYDRESPCFYAAQGWRSQYGKSAWLKSEEVADIVNVLMLSRKDAGTQSHLSQVDKNNPDGAETWDSERVKRELRSRGEGPFNSVSGVAVFADFGVGKSTEVSVTGDAGNRVFSANDFVNYFNLRAPANIQIVGPLFNAERR